jgi:hypothetical protein
MVARKVSSIGLRTLKGSGSFRVIGPVSQGVALGFLVALDSDWERLSVP